MAQRVQFSRNPAKSLRLHIAKLRHYRNKQTDLRFIIFLVSFFSSSPLACDASGKPEIGGDLGYVTRLSPRFFDKLRRKEDSSPTFFEKSRRD